MDLARIIGRTGFDRLRFVLSVLMDITGMASYLGYLAGPLAGLTEGSDVLFATVQAAYLGLAYRRLDSLPAAFLGGVEEILPGTDFVPTCTLYHVYVMRNRYGSDKTVRPEIPVVGRTDSDA